MLANSLDMLNRCNCHYNGLFGTMINSSASQINYRQSHNKQKQPITLLIEDTTMDTRRQHQQSIYSLFRSQTAMYSSSPIKLMLMIQIVLLITLLTIINHTQAQNVNILTVLRSMKIVPSILSGSVTKQAKLTIGNKEIKPGDTIPIDDLKAKETPNVSWEGGNENFDAKSTVVLLDIDRHLNTSISTVSYNHFTTVNIPGDTVSSGLHIVTYEPPGKGTDAQCYSGKHRYLLLVYHQNDAIDIAHLTDVFATGPSRKRENFNWKTFENKHGLTLIAVNAFYLQASERPGVLCNGGSSSYQISNWSSFITMIVSSLSMLLIGYCTRDSLN